MEERVPRSLRGVPPAEAIPVSALDRAKRLLEGYPFEAEEEIVNITANMSTCAEWLDSVADALGTAEVQLAWAVRKRERAVDPPWNPERLGKLDELISDLDTEAANVLLVSKEEVDKALGAVSLKWKVLVVFVEQVESGFPLLTSFLARRRLGVDYVEVVENVEELLQIIGDLAGRETASRIEEIRIGPIAATHRSRVGSVPLVSGAEVPAHEVIDFSADVAVPSESSTYLDFGDGERSDAVPTQPGSTVHVSATHTYLEEGARTIQLMVRDTSVRAFQLDVQPSVFEEQRAQFQISERQAMLATGTVTVLTGLLLLYFASNTWGSVADYLKALLWGSSISEGLKLVGNLVSRTWSTS